MSRSKEEKARYEGISWVFRQIDAGKSIEEVRKEAEYRGAVGLPIGCRMSDIEDYAARQRRNIYDTTMALQMLALMDLTARKGDKWSGKRLTALKEEFDRKLEIMADKKMNWADVLQILHDEANIDLVIHWNGEDPTKDFNPEEH